MDGLRVWTLVLSVALMAALVVWLWNRRKL